ncbi:hypothetical protein [Flavobacterium gelatinilyticum]|uniref:hypothetical protein n=1 Tax=Flavobacterium gelatinilyticum TaxID=3003260 RepID=UPI002480865C|nr:hypothetical protein [Flavobacterium gelatinilyticum]
MKNWNLYIWVTCLVFSVAGYTQEKINAEILPNRCECLNIAKNTSEEPPKKLKTLLSYDDFKKSGFDFKNGIKDYEQLFVKDASAGSVTIYSSSPIKLVYKRSDYILNLTPCRSDFNYFEIKANVQQNPNRKAIPFDITIPLSHSEIELSTSMIRRWDPKTKKTVLSNGVPAVSPLRISMQDGSYSLLTLKFNEEIGVELARNQRRSLCMNDTEISNTNVDIKIAGLNLIDLSYKSRQNESTKREMDRWLQKLNVADLNTQSYVGMMCALNKMNFPLKDFELKAAEMGSASLYLNKDVVIGQLIIKCTRTKKDSEVILNLDSDQNKTVNLTELNKEIENLGFDKVTNVLDQNFLFVYFIKYAEKK